MADEAKKPIQTPTVIAIYPKISKPDTFGKYANGKYKTRFSFLDDEAGKAAEAKFKAWCKKKAAELMPKSKKHTMPWKVDEESGRSEFSCSTSDRPPVFDTKNNKLPEGVLIGGGTKMRLFLSYGPYENRLCLYINAVQIVELVEYKPKSREDMDSPFETIDDGYEFDGNSDGDAGEGEGFGSSSADLDDEIPF